MTHSLRVVIPAVLFLLSGCASLATKPDQMCTEIAIFANESDGNAAHSVRLTTAWGGTFVKDRDVIFSKRCEHGGFAPGMRLCQYLMQNTSTEFAVYNFRRALSCLDAESYAPSAPVSVERLEAKISSYEAKGVKFGVEVSVEFSNGTASAPPSLKISAARP